VHSAPPGRCHLRYNQRMAIDGIEITYELNGKFDPATRKPVLTLTVPPANAD
jgi:hypothetical protein